jgi:hypothetical protein
MRIRTIGSALLLLALAGCSRNEPTGPPAPGGGSDTVPESPSWNEVRFGEFNVARQRLDGAFPILLEYATAVVRDADTLPVSVGGVLLNGDPLEEVEAQGMIGYQSLYGIHHEMPVRFDGSHAVFTMGENPVVGRFTDSVATPHHDIELIAPRRGEPVSRSSGLRLTWTPSGLDSVHVSISSDSTYNDLRFMTPDDGDYQVGADRLAVIPYGEITVSVLGLSMKEGHFANGRSYIISTSTSVFLTTTLVR